MKSAFIKFPPVSYPGRIYGMYSWNWNKNKWEIDKQFCNRNKIVVERNKS